VTTTTKIVGAGSNDTSYGSEGWYNPGNITASDGSMANVFAAVTNISYYIKGLMTGNEFALDQTR